MRGRHLPAIDLVRFACALLVMAHHYTAMLPLAPPPFAADMALPTRLAAWTWSGWVGVELFFVVSGYVIAASAARGSAGDFVRRRALRLAPAAWIAATLTTSVALAAAIAPSGELLARWSASMAFWPIADQADHVYWTLGIECAFYLVIAATLKARTRAIEPVGLMLAGISLAYWLARGGWGAAASMSRFADLLLLTHGAFFAVGIALSGLAAGGWSRLRVAMLAIGLAAGGCEIAAQARYMAGGLGLAAGPLAPLAIFAAGTVAIAFAGRWRMRDGRLARGVAFAGLATYPLYLTHHRAGAVLIAALCRLGVPGGVAIGLTACAALAVAAGIAAWVEPALRRWLAARLDAFTPHHAPARDTLPTASPRAG